MATTPEAPYLPWLLRHEELRPRLLVRLAAWLATSLAPDRATPLADSLYAAHAALMRADHTRWKDELAMPSPEESIAALRTHIRTRSEHLTGQLARYTGQEAKELTVRVLPHAAGEVLIGNLPLTRDERRFTAFSGAPVRLTAQPAPGQGNGKVAQHGSNLHRQLARGHQHQGTYWARLCIGRLHEALEQGQGEGSRFARARGCLGQHVAPLQHGGEHVGLNLRGGCVSLGLGRLRESG